MALLSSPSTPVSSLSYLNSSPSPPPIFPPHTPTSSTPDIYGNGTIDYSVAQAFTCPVPVAQSLSVAGLGARSAPRGVVIPDTKRNLIPPVIAPLPPV